MKTRCLLSSLTIVFAASAAVFGEDAAAFRACTLLDQPMEIGNYDVEIDLAGGPCTNFVKFAGRRVAAHAVLVVCTSFQFWIVLGRGQIDALLTGLVLSSVALFPSRQGKVGTARILPSFLCAGLAMLAKGPVGLVLPVLD